MTQQEIKTIANIIRRLKQPNCDCGVAIGADKIVAEANEMGMECVSRIYLDSWIIPALELLLPGEARDPSLAVSLSER